MLNIKYVLLGNYFSFLFASVFLISCKTENTFPKTIISLASFKKASLDTVKGWTLLAVLKTYPAQIDCNANEKYANLYICKKWSNGDTVYVFENCQKVSRYALTDTTSHYPIVIDTTNLIMQYPSTVTIFAPTDFKLPNDAKYFFAHVAFLTEY
jgi:hypothetical protein